VARVQIFQQCAFDKRAPQEPQTLRFHQGLHADQYCHQVPHVPYKGASSAQASTIAGDTQMFCDSVGNSQSMVEQSTAPHVSPVHLGVMTSWNVLTRIVGIAAKDVVPLDLLWFEELHSLEVL
jgi:hypothetical protein